MNQGYKFFQKDIVYRLLKKELLKDYDKELIEKIYHNAGVELEKLYELYSDVPMAQKIHTHEEIFPRVAMYSALKVEFNEKAIEIMDKAVALSGNKVGKLLARITSLPLM